jgi:hypothetical protein
MNRLSRCCLAALLCTAASASAADAPPAGGMDMTKVGPVARMPKNEKADQKELAEWFKAYQAADQKNDLDAIVAMTDFPVTMISDTMKGEFKASEVSKDQYVAMMKPFMTPEAKKGMKTSGQKGTCHILSDDLASCEGEYTMEMGKTKAKINNQMLMTRVDGKWKTKTMVEAGWGDMPTGGSAPAPAAAPAAAPAPASAAKK